MTDLLSQIEAAAALGAKATKRPWELDTDDAESSVKIIDGEGGIIGAVFGDDEFPCLEDDERPAVTEEAAATAKYIRAAANLPLSAIAEELRTARAAREAAERERDEAKEQFYDLEIVMSRSGWRRCDIPACNCGSWHQPPNTRAESAESDRDRLAAECESLRAVVERLPKTADGVPITPGMSVWTPKGMFSGTDVREHTPVLVGDEDMLGEVEEYLWTWYAHSCYSTRAAAEAAALAEKGGSENV